MSRENDAQRAGAVNTERIYRKHRDHHAGQSHLHFGHGAASRPAIAAIAVPPPCTATGSGPFAATEREPFAKAGGAL